MIRTPQTLGVAALLAAGLVGCGGSPPAGGEPDEPELPATPAEFTVGEELYEANCATCHSTSRDGAPRLGFKRVWAERMEQGEEVMAQHAVEGIGLMPPRADSDLTDEQILAVVRYMIYRAELDIPAGG